MIEIGIEARQVNRLPLNARQLRECVEMSVAGAENKRMLQDEGRDPHIVGRDGSALLTQLSVERAVMMSCLFVGVENANAGLHKKTAQDRFIARPLTADGKSSA